MLNDRSERRGYLFLLDKPGASTLDHAREYLLELGVKVTAEYGIGALTGFATLQQVEAAASEGLFATISKGPIGHEAQTLLGPEYDDAVRIWNVRHSEEFRKLSRDRTHEGVSWGDSRREQEAAPTRIVPEEFRDQLLEALGVSEKELFEKYGSDERKVDFRKFETELAQRLDDEDLAYELARVTDHLGPAWYPVILVIDIAILLEILKRLFTEVACWKMERKIAVGVVFVESSRRGGPKFSAGERATLEGEVVEGLELLADLSPTAANLSWVFDWQRVRIDVANGDLESDEAYWRDPAMGEVNYDGSTYPAEWSSVAKYREDMRLRNRAAHAFVIFVTPYGTDWHAYASSGRVTLANRNNWGNWGVGNIDRITAHEACHLFGAADEYTGSGTPCSSCNTRHGCYLIPNGNCGSCARSRQECMMGENVRRLCSWTQGQIGWSDLFVELTTANEIWAGTDDTVWLDIGDRTFELDTPNYDDREQNNRDGYALNYTGITRDDIKRVGIRKSPDGFAGGWMLGRVRVRVAGELVCDSGTIDQWLQDQYRWWASVRCGTSTDIVNRLQVWVTTADVWWAGTDDDVTFRMGGRNWNLDNEGQDDFERGSTDSFLLDPGTGLYLSALGPIRVSKSPDGIAGGWRLKGLRIDVNGSTIFNDQSINRWLEDDSRVWHGHL